MKVALTRPVSPAIVNCQLTYLNRQPISYEKAVEQHQEYKCALQKLGLQVVSLPPEPELPDAVFVEDNALVLKELAVIGATGIPSRKSELRSVQEFLGRHREVRFLGEDVRFEGGDVLRHGNTLYIGQSQRTCQGAIERLQAVLGPFGYSVKQVRVSGCLHLSTGASFIGNNTVLVNPDWIDTSAFTNCAVMKVSEKEPWAANSLTINGVTLMPDEFPLTRLMLERSGFCVHGIRISEFLKAEGGVSCLTNILEVTNDLLNGGDI